MKEQLYDGPYDGLEVETSGKDWGYGEYEYTRRGDGRLYLKDSKWEPLPRKHDRL